MKKISQLALFCSSIAAFNYSKVCNTRNQQLDAPETFASRASSCFWAHRQKCDRQCRALLCRAHWEDDEKPATIVCVCCSSLDVLGISPHTSRPHRRCRAQVFRCVCRASRCLSTDRLRWKIALEVVLQKMIVFVLKSSHRKTVPSPKKCGFWASTTLKWPFFVLFFILLIVSRRSLSYRNIKKVLPICAKQIRHNSVRVKVLAVCKQKAFGAVATKLRQKLFDAIVFDLDEKKNVFFALVFED